MDKKIIQADNDTSFSIDSFLSSLSELKNGLARISNICEDIAKVADSGLPTEDIIQSYYN